MTRSEGAGSAGAAQIASNAGEVDAAALEPLTTAGATHSRYVQRVRRRYGAQLQALPAGAPDASVMQSLLRSLLSQGLAPEVALRTLRHMVLERLAVLDAEQGAELGVITHAMSDLAAVALDAACCQVLQSLCEVHGQPIGENGQKAQLWVVGMGKLGARELNVSSDIDLIYVYDQDGQTEGNAQGHARLTNHEFFAKAVRAISQMIGDITDHGQVFRVDLALRPNGKSGPTVVSLGALEEYLQVQGREWERFAWLKSRVVAPFAALESGSAEQLRDVVLPFVFRKYLDYNVFHALRDLHSQVRSDAMRRSAGRPERANDVKLSRGGIREIEFTVQLLQVVRGGQFPELRTRATLQALPRLVRAGLMPPETAQALADAYVFFRRAEHRIQYLDDLQTHTLPTSDEDVQWIASSMGYIGSCAFLHELDAHRERVALEFDRLLGKDERSDCKGCRSATAPTELDELLAQLPPALAERLGSWREHPRVLALREASRARLMQLLERTAQWLSEGRVSEQGALRLTDWLEPLLRRESYLALLLERPAVHERLLKLLGAAKWPVRFVLKHPGVIDELANPTWLSERFDPKPFEAELERRREALAKSGQDDDEALLGALRRAQHAEVLRTLTRDVEGVLTVEQVADDLSALADAVLRITTRWCWQRLRPKLLKNFGEPMAQDARLAVIAYGKLGGKELGYGSDLDIVFVFDDPHEAAQDIYNQLARKLINWLTVKTGEGDLYEIDTALRPNGNSGLLVTSFEAYADYQQQRGSNTAWTWEHQAMTRARFVMGGELLRQRFEVVREAVITAPREQHLLAQEITAMRSTVHKAHPVKEGFFDLKHSSGGMVDAEFAVQWLVLAHAAHHPALRTNSGNIALLIAAEQAGLLPAGQGQAAANAYRSLRHAQHLARLNEEPTQVPQAQLATEREAIGRLWQTVFG
jgi:[glutamine synthetase] adenylyltransferase / [glutamine synthetase]-adenylyl-L-tyrosine phosphorylase